MKYSWIVLVVVGIDPHLEVRSNVNRGEDSKNAVVVIAARQHWTATFQNLFWALNCQVLFPFVHTACINSSRGVTRFTCWPRRLTCSQPLHCCHSRVIPFHLSFLLSQYQIASFCLIYPYGFCYTLAKFLQGRDSKEQACAAR